MFRTWRKAATASWHIRLPLDPRSVSTARAFVRQHLGADHPAYEDVRLAVSELVTNASAHGGRGNDGDLLKVTLRATPEFIRVEVLDPGGVSWPQARDDMTPEDESGRGLTLVARLSGQRWGVRDHGAAGRSVWCVIDADPTGPATKVHSHRHPCGGEDQPPAPAGDLVLLRRLGRLPPATRNAGAFDLPAAQRR